MCLCEDGIRVFEYIVMLGENWMRNRGNAHEYINDDLCTDDARFDGRFDDDAIEGTLFELSSI